MPSIDDVARKAGVSTATVSRTFRSPELLTAETRRRVLEAARQLDYAPRARRVARGSANGRAAGAVQEAIGFQFFAAGPADTLQSNSFYASMLMGVQQEAAALGLNVLIHTTDRHQLAREMPKMVLDRAIGGMLLVGAGSDPETLSLFAVHVPHIVLLDDRDVTGRFECVTSDGFNGAREATDYLLGLGHRRIGFFLAEGDVRSFRDRLHGYVAALFDTGITPDPRLVIGGTYADSEAMRTERLATLLKGSERPTALLVANDEHAFFVLRALREMGLRVPEDISLIGFDDIPFSDHTHPPLTTVRVDKEAMGRLAVHRLVGRMHSPEAAAILPVCNPVPVTLVIRKSCRRV